ncbi:type I pullulanase [Exiguobacterium flavidum]|uniref:type I pullulanase n=1 Tax=Exiguobacterium flavidum TaxID=2184695 RepID=UPI000DF81004|nr:type I pullulanase [Exiguobacterium flavidum]
MHSFHTTEIHHSIISARFATFESILLEVRAGFDLSALQLYRDERPQPFQVGHFDWIEEGNLRVTLHLEHPADLTNVYRVVDQSGQGLVVVPAEIMQTSLFDSLYSYEGPLGLVFSVKTIDCFVWSPVAHTIELVLYTERGEELTALTMEREERGVWHVQIARETLFYRYRVATWAGCFEVVDPYAKAVSANGEYGVLLDVEGLIAARHAPPAKRPVLVKPTDAVIYEANIRDLTIDPSSGSSHPGEYRGVFEKGTRSPNDHPTGLDYLIDLGITHLQLLPVHDFGTTEEISRSPYNWGYDPVNWFALEGSYASDATDPAARVIEYADLIEELHKSGIRVTFDVVMNHVHLRDESALNRLVPHYYFRKELDGSYSNGTGVGNDTASERFMMRRLIVDCLTFYARVYRVDAFRFDLMGIHDIETMTAVRSALDAIDPSILIYGEGWDLATPLPAREKAISQWAARMPGIGHFNDVFRDALKGSTFNEHDRGFALGDIWKAADVRSALPGSVTIPDETIGRFPEPSYSINYVEAHDNHTLADKIALAVPEASEDERRQMGRFAQAIALLAEGIPFLHAGQEFGRTKQGVENSYNAPDEINRMDWLLRDARLADVAYVKGLIQIRRMHSSFRYHRRNQVQALFRFLPTGNHGVIAYEVDATHSYDAWQRVIVVHNSTRETYELDLPHGRFNVYAMGDQASPEPIEKGVSCLVVHPLSTTIGAC